MCVCVCGRGRTICKLALFLIDLWVHYELTRRALQEIALHVTQYLPSHCATTVTIVKYPASRKSCVFQLVAICFQVLNNRDECPYTYHFVSIRGPGALVDSHKIHYSEVSRYPCFTEAHSIHTSTGRKMVNTGLAVVLYSLAEHFPAKHKSINFV